MCHAGTVAEGDREAGVRRDAVIADDPPDIFEGAQHRQILSPRLHRHSRRCRRIRQGPDRERWWTGALLAGNFRTLVRPL